MPLAQRLRYPFVLADSKAVFPRAFIFLFPFFKTRCNKIMKKTKREGKRDVISESPIDILTGLPLLLQVYLPFLIMPSLPSHRLLIATELASVKNTFLIIFGLIPFNPLGVVTLLYMIYLSRFLTGRIPPCSS